MEWLIESLTNKLRSDSNIASEVGTDTDGDVKVYHSMAPALTIAPYPYVVFHTDLGGETEWTYSNSAVADNSDRIEEWTVEIEVFSTTARKATNIYEYIRQELDLTKMDNLEYSEADASPEVLYTTIHIIRDAPAMGPERDDAGIWRLSVTYRIRAIAQ
jgi:hypothetical protein